MCIGIPCSAPFPLQLGVTIGFSPTTYSVSEDVGTVSVAVSLRNGILDRDVVVTLQTLDGTAMGEFHCTEPVPCSVSSHHILYPSIFSWHGFSTCII